jgi:hypothetical protein
MVWSVSLRRIVAEKLVTSCKNGGEEGVKVREQRRYKSGVSAPAIHTQKESRQGAIRR